MSGLYNVVFGENPYSEPLNELLLISHMMVDPDLEKRAVLASSWKIPRWRDTWAERHGDALLIRAYTRVGGHHRPDYEDEIGVLQDHPWYDHDVDDVFDSTYASFYFRVPLPGTWEPFDQEEPKIGKTVWEAVMPWAIEPVDMSAKWQGALDNLKSATPEEIQALADRFDNNIQVIKIEDTND